MDAEELARSVSLLRDRASDAHWQEICGTLRGADAKDSFEDVLLRLPSSISGDSLYLLRRCIHGAQGQMSPAAFGLFLEVAGHAHEAATSKQQTELVWTGPSTPTLAVRRTDQVLYDLISCAKEDIFLVTFAAAYVNRLKEALLEASARGVRIRLLLEFKEDSRGQLSVSALNAFEGLEGAAEIYAWPLEKRGLNQAGKPGKLHAKCALVDDCAVVSSANLTDDAFNRNMELGILFRGGSVPRQLRNHFDKLIEEGVLMGR